MVKNKTAGQPGKKDWATGSFDLVASRCHSQRKLTLARLNTFKLIKSTIFLLVTMVCCLQATAQVQQPAAYNEKARAALEQEDWSIALQQADAAIIAAGQTHNWSSMADALAIKAIIAQAFYDDFQQEEKLSMQALELYKHATDTAQIGHAYATYAFARFAQSDYVTAIHYQQMAINNFKSRGNKNSEADALITLSNIYSEKGVYDSAFAIAQQAVNLARQYHNDTGIAKALQMVAAIYFRLGDYQSALTTHEKARKYFHSLKSKHTKALPILLFAETLARLQQWKEAGEMYDSIDSSRLSEQEFRFYLVSKGEFAMETGHYQQAATYLSRGLQLHRIKNDGNEIMRALNDLAQTTLALQHPKQSLQYGFEALQLARTVDSKQGLLSSYASIYQTYKSEQRSDSALYYFQQYVTMKDTVMSAQAKGKIAAYTYEQVISRLNAENNLREQTVQSMVNEKRLILLAAGIAILLLIALGRNMRLQRAKAEHLQQLALNQLEQEQLRNEKNSVTLQQQKADLEMKMLRAQMNPHFIFNSLNAINLYILQNDADKASEYLTQFSKLVRMILQHSRHALISLENEITALRLYLEMEMIRFNDRFDYSISIGEDVDTFSSKIPPLVIQPFVENAIRHGLMQKPEKGYLHISFFIEEDWLICQVTDDGIGRQRAKQLKALTDSTHSSLGIHITSERISLLSKEFVQQQPVVISDLFDESGQAAGTRVTIKLPLLYESYPGG